MSYDALEEIEEKLPLPNNSEYDPNHTLITTFNSTTDTNNFCNTYNHNNGYNGLKLGQRIQINDGTYNKAWYIAGFDCEADNIASDGTPNNNGYGICLFPEQYLVETYYDDRSGDWATTYIESYMHTTLLTEISSNLKNVLGDHLINRNVLLCNQKGSVYQWTTSFADLISVGQVTGTFGVHYTIYDDGEANYRLPLFNHMYPETKTTFTRNRYVSYFSGSSFCMYALNFSRTPFLMYNPKGLISVIYSDSDTGSICPMIYIR